MMKNVQHIGLVVLLVAAILSPGVILLGAAMLVSR
jgi:hypothetical protein